MTNYSHRVQKKLRLLQLEVIHIEEEELRIRQQLLLIEKLTYNFDYVLFAVALVLLIIDITTEQLSSPLRLWNDEVNRAIIRVLLSSGITFRMGVWLNNSTRVPRRFNFIDEKR